MADRLGVVGSRPIGDQGLLLLSASDGTSVLVEPDLTDDELMARYDLDRVVRAEHLDWCAALHLDGPLAGTSGYALNRLGSRVSFALPPRPGGPRGTYEVVELAAADRPARLRFVGYVEDQESHE